MSQGESQISDRPLPLLFPFIGGFKGLLPHTGMCLVSENAQGGSRPYFANCSWLPSVEIQLKQEKGVTYTSVKLKPLHEAHYLLLRKQRNVLG